MIRIFETLLQIYYQLHVKKEQLRSQKDNQNTKKKYFKNKMGLIVDFPKPGFGSTDERNTIRGYSLNPEFSA